MEHVSWEAKLLFPSILGNVPLPTLRLLARIRYLCRLCRLRPASLRTSSARRLASMCTSHCSTLLPERRPQHRRRHQYRTMPERRPQHIWDCCRPQRLRGMMLGFFLADPPSQVPHHPPASPKENGVSTPFGKGCTVPDRRPQDAGGSTPLGSIF